MLCRKLGLALLLYVLWVSSALAETDTYFKSWNVANVTGSLSQDHRWQYLFQPRLVLIDDKYKYHDAMTVLGVGYQVNPDVILYMLNAYNATRSTLGTMQHVYQLREQCNWTLVNRDLYNLLSITRLEERFNLAEPGVSYRFREWLSLRLPFKTWEGHSLFMFDEVFFNLNHPDWVSNTFFEQNRAFIGIGTLVSRHFSFDIGYMNQYQIRNTDAMSNVVYFAA